MRLARISFELAGKAIMMCFYSDYSIANANLMFGKKTFAIFY